MPIIQINLMEGRSTEQKIAAAAAITEAVTHSLGVKPEAVRILFHELGPDGFFVAGKTMAQRAAEQRAQSAQETTE